MKLSASAVFSRHCLTICVGVFMSKISPGFNLFDQDTSRCYYNMAAVKCPKDLKE